MPEAGATGAATPAGRWLKASLYVSELLGHHGFICLIYRDIAAAPQTQSPPAACAGTRQGRRCREFDQRVAAATPPATTKNYGLAADAGGIELSAGRPDAGLAMPGVESVLVVPDGVVVVVVDGGELVVAGVVVVVVSTFLPQAPSASMADRVSATAITDFRGVGCMSISFASWRHIESLNLASMPCFPDETPPCRRVGNFRMRWQSLYMGCGVGWTSPGSGGVDSGCKGSGGGTLGLVAIR